MWESGRPAIVLGETAPAWLPFPEIVLSRLHSVLKCFGILQAAYGSQSTVGSG